jgi:hypothetical protein
MMDEFDDAFDPAASAEVRVRSAAAGPGPDAESAGPRIPELVSQVYEQAPAPVRAKLLETLLGPVGPLALVAIGAGAFTRFMHRLQGDASPVSLDDAARITAGHVLELARYVEQCSPHVLLRIGSLIANTPLGMATLSGSALLIALQVWRRPGPGGAR